MQSHILKVAIDESFFIEKDTNDPESVTVEDIVIAFSKTKAQYVTTFTSEQDHIEIGNTTAGTFRENFLRLKFRQFQILSGGDVISKILKTQISKNDLKKLPDIIITNREDLQLAATKIGVMFLGNEDFNNSRKVSLTISTPYNFFRDVTMLPFWKIRIEDRYLIKNIESENDVNDFFSRLNLKKISHHIDIIYSQESKFYREWNLNYSQLHSEIERRKRLIQNIGSFHQIRFFPSAGHDRFVCTNSSLFIFGNSITSDSVTHCTYYPILEYYGTYFTPH